MRFRNQTKENIATLFQLVRAAERKVDQFREEMAAEFVKNNKKTSDHQAETSNKLAEIDQKLENFRKQQNEISNFLIMQRDMIAAIILACGLREDGKIEKAYSQIRSERSKLHDIAAKGINGKVKESKFNGEMTTEPTLFPVEPEKPAADWVNGAEAAKMLGWQTCSSEKLIRARIAFRQAAKNKPLSVNVKSVKDFIARRKPRRRETFGK